MKERGTDIAMRQSGPKVTGGNSMNTRYAYGMVFILALFFAGCYTQFGPTRGGYARAPEPSATTEESYAQDDSTADSSGTDTEYEQDRQQLYYGGYAPQYESPGYSVGFGVAVYNPYWLSPWDPWGYPWSTGGWFYPNYGYGYRSHYGYSGYRPYSGHGHFWQGHSGYAQNSPRGSLPPLGRTRGLGSTGRSITPIGNGYGSYGSSTPSERMGSRAPVLPSAGSRITSAPTRSTTAATSRTMATPNVRRGRQQAAGRGISSPRPVARGRDGGYRSTGPRWSPPPSSRSAPAAAPAYNPPRSAPSAPASAPSGGNRGGGNDGGSRSGGGSSGGHRR